MPAELIIVAPADSELVQARAHLKGLAEEESRLGRARDELGNAIARSYQDAPLGAASEPDPEARVEAIDAKVKEATDAIGRLLR